MADELRIVEGPSVGMAIPVDQTVVLGRAEDTAGILGRDSEISRRHARVTRAIAGGLILEDAGSMNGTYLNGWKISAPQILSPGDRIQLGATVLEVAGETVLGRRPAILSGVRNYEELRPKPQDSVLYANAVRKSYGSKEVLKGVDLEVAPGEIVGLLGGNGAGKTSFVSIVAGLRPATSGTVLVNGIDALKEPRRARRFLGIAPQDLGIYPTMTVRRNLLFFGELAGLRGAELRSRVEETAQALSLDPMFEQVSGTLSGGQQRRLHTAMAMLHKPPLLILDEPTVGADVRTRQEILDTVKALAAEGRGVIYSTHYMPEIEDLGASVAILHGGEIVARGSIAELIASHSEPFVELTFDGPAPDLALRGDIDRDDAALRIKNVEPTQAVHEALSALGPEPVPRLLSVEIVRPSLESVYLAITAQRYKGEEDVAATNGGPPQAEQPPQAVPA
jgi:ABC-2 type transport system ATP-binding protein